MPHWVFSLCNDLSKVFDPITARNNKLYRVGHGYSEQGVPSKALTMVPSVVAVFGKDTLLGLPFYPV